MDIMNDREIICIMGQKGPQGPQGLKGDQREIGNNTIKYILYETGNTSNGQGFQNNSLKDVLVFFRVDVNVTPSNKAIIYIKLFDTSYADKIVKTIQGQQNNSTTESLLLTYESYVIVPPTYTLYVFSNMFGSLAYPLYDLIVVENCELIH